MSTNTRKRSHFQSSLENFIKTMDFKHVERKSLPMNGRLEYEYPLMDTKGFFKIHKIISSLNKKIYMPEKGIIVKVASKMVNKEYAMVALAIYDGTTYPKTMYIHELKVIDGKTQGMLRISLSKECEEKDLEKLKKEILKFIPEQENK